VIKSEDCWIFSPGVGCHSWLVAFLERSAAKIFSGGTILRSIAWAAYAASGHAATAPPSSAMNAHRLTQSIVGAGEQRRGYGEAKHPVLRLITSSNVVGCTTGKEASRPSGRAMPVVGLFNTAGIGLREGAASRDAAPAAAAPASRPSAATPRRRTAPWRRARLRAKETKPCGSPAAKTQTG
jgi:hypothetical protein